MKTSIIAYDNSAIYGIAYSVSGALKHAKGFVDNVAELKTAPASDELAKRVRDTGGDIGFSVEKDGIAYYITNNGELL